MAKLCIQVFSKSPRLTSVKTRLSSALTLEQRQRLQSNLLQHGLNTCSRIQSTLELWTYPDSDQTIEWIAKRFQASVHRQKGEDLGGRMLNALNQGNCENDATLLIGTDCPGISADYLEEALDSLTTQRPTVVLGPAYDGGFVLIGTNSPLPKEAFKNVKWGTDNVLVQVIKNMHALGMNVHQLDTLHDIDRPRDLVHLPPQLMP